jgi:hypothetical protein
MRIKANYSIVDVQRFIEATRDSGYKDISAAIAELVDNSLEANATAVSIALIENNISENKGIKVVVADNGHGMCPSILRLALRFGGSTRFDSRAGIGRYGMGLPNSSLSQTRRVDIYTWTDPSTVWWTYLDVDEITLGKTFEVPPPRRRVLPEQYDIGWSASGTVVVWSNCDRINRRNIKAVTSRLHETLGQTFRVALKHRISIKINGVLLRAIDPLFIQKGNNLKGAIQYGPELKYKIKVPPRKSLKDTTTSVVSVKFSEMAIEEWCKLTNNEKRAHRISKRAGISVLRAGREIDYGWFFMGSKRKENYDDWWRGEIRFEAELDELFGVTHTKQGIRPTPELVNILAPDIERIAHELNGRVRRRFLAIKSEDNRSAAEVVATSRDYLLEPPSPDVQCLRHAVEGNQYLAGNLLFSEGSLPGFSYRIECKALKDVSFFVPVVSDREVVILLNEEHPFYERIYTQLGVKTAPDRKNFLKALELLILSAARAECSATGRREKAYASSLRQTWSNVLAAFLA